MNILAIIPHYNHSQTLFDVVNRLRALELPVLVVDDGSSPEHQQALKALEKQTGVQVYYRATNGGKGAAMKSGFQQAFKMGACYALQVDADGQHQLSDVQVIREILAENPTALICGCPIYGDDAPKSRLYGRKITDFWNIIHTHSFDIKDGMCGFRLYPLAAIVPILTQESLGDRMDFDTDILVKAHWYQIPICWFDTPVHYDQNGVSHFRAWKDNWRITKMHTRLFFGMLKRFFTGKPL